MNLFCGIILSVLFAVASTAAVPGDVDKPTEEQIFGFLTEDLNTTNLLYICDLSKDFTYLCNASALGYDHIRGHVDTTDSKEATEKAGKMKLFNISGHWSDSDGFMKSSYITLDYLDIVAKCYFRTKYYECFGVPRCGPGFGLFTNCNSGEPWRGNYHGTPVFGFQGNITADAQQNAVSTQTITPETSTTRKSHAAVGSTPTTPETTNTTRGCQSQGPLSLGDMNFPSIDFGSLFPASSEYRVSQQLRRQATTRSRSLNFPFRSFEFRFPASPGDRVFQQLQSQLFSIVKDGTDSPQSGGGSDSAKPTKPPPFQPTADEIFGPVFEAYDMENVLYICDFTKDFRFNCTHTDQGLKTTKNSDRSSRGKWDVSQGFMKTNYLTMDYLDIVAKCAFLTTYYECFGVMKCLDGPNLPCYGGEPWEGFYKGNPFDRKGFRANITAEAISGGQKNFATDATPAQRSSTRRPTTSTEEGMFDRDENPVNPREPPSELHCTYHAIVADFAANAPNANWQRFHCI